MRILKLILFLVALCLLSSIGYGQSTFYFGATTRTTDTSRTKGILRLDAYANSNTNLFLTVNAQGKVVFAIPAGGGGNADSATFVTQFQNDTAKANIYAAIAAATGTTYSPGWGLALSSDVFYFDTVNHRATSVSGATDQKLITALGALANDNSVYSALDALKLDAADSNTWGGYLTRHWQYNNGVLIGQSGQIIFEDLLGNQLSYHNRLRSVYQGATGNSGTEIDSTKVGFFWSGGYGHIHPPYALPTGESNWRPMPYGYTFADSAQVTDSCAAIRSDFPDVSGFIPYTDTPSVISTTYGNDTGNASIRANYYPNSNPAGYTSNTGTVTQVTVNAANGFAGTVSDPTTTAAVTLTATVNAPVVAANGTALIAATTTGSGSTVALSASPTFSGTVTATDGLVIDGGTSTGTMIGAATNQKLGFFGATPVIFQNGNIPDALALYGLVGSGTVDASTDMTGVLPIANGGTNTSSYTTGDILICTTTNVLTKLSAGSDGQTLTMSGGIPAWVTPTGGGGGSIDTMHMIIGGDFVTSSTTFVPITGLSTGVLALDHGYAVDIWVDCVPSTTAGLRVTFRVTPNPAWQSYHFWGVTTNPTLAGFGAITNGAENTTWLISAGVTGNIHIQGTFYTPSSGSPVGTVEIKKITSGTATARAGSSYFTIRPLQQ